MVYCTRNMFCINQFIYRFNDYKLLNSHYQATERFSYHKFANPIIK
jgi:hypothetical protein